METAFIVILTVCFIFPNNPPLTESVAVPLTRMRTSGRISFESFQFKDQIFQGKVSSIRPSAILQKNLSFQCKRPPCSQSFSHSAVTGKIRGVGTFNGTRFFEAGQALASFRHGCVGLGESKFPRFFEFFFEKSRRLTRGASWIWFACRPPGSPLKSGEFSRFWPLGELQPGRFCTVVLGLYSLTNFPYPLSLTLGCHLDEEDDVCHNTKMLLRPNLPSSFAHDSNHKPIFILMVSSRRTATGRSAIFPGPPA